MKPKKVWNEEQVDARIVRCDEYVSHPTHRKYVADCARLRVLHAVVEHLDERADYRIRIESEHQEHRGRERLTFTAYVGKLTRAAS